MRPGNFLDFLVGTIQKKDEVNKLDQWKITYWKIAAYNLIIQPQQETRAQSGLMPAHPVGDREKLLHISLQPPTALPQPPQRVLS